MKDQHDLGGDEFINRIEMKKEGSGSWVYNISLGAISNEVSRAMRIGKEKLYSLTRDHEGAHGRGIVAYLARVISDYMVRR